MKYQHILQAVYDTPWAIIPERLATILAILHERAAGHEPSAEEIRFRLELGRVEHGATEGVHDVSAAATGASQRVSGAVAVLPVLGVLTQRGGMTASSEPLTSTARLAQNLRQLIADDTVGAIVLDVDSPGGSVFGVEELAGEIYRSRGSKPIVAVANSLAASAAYWIASSADEVVVTPGGEVGSIGVFTAHQDLSALLEAEGVKVTLISAGKYKVEANPYQPLGEEAQAAIQSRVDDYYNAFVATVARGRGVKVSDVRDGFGQARVVGAKEAVALGMADRVATLDQVVADLMKAKRGNGARAEAGLQLKRRRLELHGALTAPAAR